MSVPSQFKIPQVLLVVSLIAGLALVLKSFLKSEAPTTASFAPAKTAPKMDEHLQSANPRSISSPQPSAHSAAPTPSSEPAKLGTESALSPVTANKVMDAAEKKHQQFVENKMKEMLASEDKARLVLKEVEKCITMLKSGSMPIPSYPGSEGEAEKAAIYSRQKESCLAIGKQTVDKYPSLKKEFEDKILTPSRDI